MHFALTFVQRRRLLAAADLGDEEVLAVVEEIEQDWDEPFLVETDEAWVAIHRCLSGDRYAGPLREAVLGGRSLHRGDDYLVSYLDADRVREVAAALRPLDEGWLRDRYATPDEAGPAGEARPPDEEEIAYVWANLTGLIGFFRRAAAAGRAVIFTADR